MNLHEYQAKALFLEYGLPVPKGFVIHHIEELSLLRNSLNAGPWVVKAQVHAGGRGKAGGVKLVNTKEEILTLAKALLHSRLVTYQTDKQGQPVNAILIEETAKIAKELYLGMIIDRSQQKIVVMASTEGGVEIEKVALETPDKIFKLTIDPFLEVLPYQVRALGRQLGFNSHQTQEFLNILTKLGSMFMACDFSLCEINPLIITEAGHLLCLDAKINVDDNALYRQPKIRELRDTTQEDARELRAREWELNYVSLDGDIGCMVNGAGLAMATMDLIKLEGGDPANFLDVGGGATEERVKEAFKIILSDAQVKAVLVNIFGGIVRCDLIAEGIIGAISEVGIQVPVVVRLEGNHAAEARDRLAKSNLNIIACSALEEAAIAAVTAVKSQKNAR